jgi:hypothetical protein
MLIELDMVCDGIPEDDGVPEVVVCEDCVVPEPWFPPA